MTDVISPTASASTDATQSARETYDSLAEVYDAYTAADDYDRWSSMLNAVIEEIVGVRAVGRTLLDAACGTGKSTFALADRGYEVSGFDISSAMIEQARSKASPEQASRLWVDDMTDFHVPQPYDVITCLDDAVNYVLNPADLHAMFARVSESLSPGEIFAFDVNSRRTYETHWLTDSVDDSSGNVVFARRSLTPEPFRPEQLSSFMLYSFIPDTSRTSWRQLVCTHTERHYTADWLTSALRHHGLRPVRTMGLHDSGTFDTHLDETFHTKAVHFAVKD